jgi:hypothetical protein
MSFYAVFPSLKQNLPEMHCSFKSSNRKSQIALNMHNNKHPLGSMQRVMAASLTRLTQKIVIMWHLAAESCIICLLGPSGESGNLWTCLPISGLHHGSESVLICRSLLPTTIFIITLLLGVTESIQWVPLHQKFIHDFPSTGRGQEGSCALFVGTLETNQPTTDS